MASIEDELRDYAARRVNGTSPAALAMVARSAGLYRQTIRVLKRSGEESNRFWNILEELSASFDDIKDGLAGPSDYYLNAEVHWDELVMPALRSTKGIRGGRVVAHQLSISGDLVIHVHLERLTPAQLHAGLTELLRILGGVKGDPHALSIRFGVVTAATKMLFMTSARQAGITPMFGDFRTTFNAEEAARAARGGVLRSALRLLANPLGLAGMLGLPEWALADLEEEQKVLHILHSASQCSAAPIAVGDRAALASVARWAQGKPEVVAMLLRRLRLPPHHHFFAMHGVRLAARLASVSPPLFEELKKGGMRPAIQAMQASPSCSPEDALELEEWLTKLFVEGIELGGRAFAGQPGMQPEAAAQRGPQAQAQAMREELSALPVRELKQRLQASGMDATGCTEKSDLVDRLLAGASGAAAAAGSSCSGSGPAPPADERADERQCIVCGAARGAGIKLKRCGGCLADQVLFCSGACQAAFWPRHKAECKAAQRAARGR